jgi:hypothetical protein
VDGAIASVEAYRISTLRADAQTWCISRVAAESDELEADMSTNTNTADAAPQLGTSGRMPRAGLSLRVRLRRARLDRDLADARVGERSEEHALRAAQLTSGATRCDTARSLREVVAAAENPRAEWFGSTALLDRDNVLPWRDGLTALAERLDQPGPIGPCGVARARVLTYDGMGPMYNPASEQSMGEAISWIAEGLDMSGLDGGHDAVRASHA